MSKKTKLPIYTLQDVSWHSTVKDCWITLNGKVYNVSGFVSDHPGGEDLILQYAGKDVGTAMVDTLKHERSSAAYDMLSEYTVGKIGAAGAVVSDDWQPTDDFHPEETLPEDDFAGTEFIDLRKPMLRQIWESSFSKDFYLQQVHQPRHVTKTARLFGPDILEMLTRTEWYVVPLFWLPIVSVIFLRSALQFANLAPPSVLHSLAYSPVYIATIPASAFAKTFKCFLIGNVIWTILEYTMHRFLFHIDVWLPDSPIFLTMHFLLHGIHHYLPMDRLRLVMPPIMFFVLQIPFTQLGYALFSPATTNGIVAGTFAFYVLYDCMHYALHHTRLPGHLQQQKKYHLAHHYKNYELGFGVTSKIWDYVFGTVLKV